MLPSVPDLRDRLKIENTIEDVALQDLLDYAYAVIQGLLRRPIGLELASYTFEQPRNASAMSITALSLPNFPIGAAGDSASNYSVSNDIQITDGEGTLLPSTDYRVDTDIGRIYAVSPFVFDTWPYTAVYAHGLGARSDYAVIESILGAAILDLASDLYIRRNATATQESTGGGVSTAYGSQGVPDRVLSIIKPYRLARVL